MFVAPKRHRCPECGRTYKQASMARECCLRDVARIMSEAPRKGHRAIQSP